MNANQKDLEIEDDLAKGVLTRKSMGQGTHLTIDSTKAVARPQVEDLLSIEEELCIGKRRQISRFTNRIARPEPDGAGRGR